MRIFVATDVKVFRCGDKIYAQEKHATIFNRYHEAFGQLVLCAREMSIDAPEKGFVDITAITERVIVIDSLLGMLLGKQNRQIEREIRTCDLVVARCHGLAAYRAADCARKLHKPYLAESMGCAWDAYWNHGLSGKFIAVYMYLTMKQVVRHADYALYVTEQFLQNRYPCRNDSIAASNVNIPAPDASVLNARLEGMRKGPLREVTLMTTAAVDVRYKGQKYVLQAIPVLNKLGIRVKYRIVGEGKQSYLRSVAEKYGVTDQVEFVGRIPLAEVFELLDQTDLYIQPSLQEGLPRSVIEAMSRGCACIGARTAGIPELLEKDFVVRRKDAADIAAVAKRYCDMSSEERQRIARRNFAEAGKYTVDVLNKRRSDYFARIAAEIGAKNA